VLRLLDDVPAWHTRRLKRLTSTPKRYVTDSGLAAWLMGAGREALKLDGTARGRILDTFVAAQLRTTSGTSRPSPSPWRSSSFTHPGSPPSTLLPTRRRSLTLAHEQGHSSSTRTGTAVSSRRDVRLDALRANELLVDLAEPRLGRLNRRNQQKGA